MTLLAADYVILGAAAFFAVVGLVRGLSGEVGSVGGWVAAAVAAYFSWPHVQGRSAEPWIPPVAVGVVALVAFFLARVTLSKAVHFMLAQPTDALLGLLVGCAKVAAAVVFASRFEVAVELSSIVREVAARVG